MFLLQLLGHLYKGSILLFGWLIPALSSVKGTAVLPTVY